MLRNALLFYISLIVCCQIAEGQSYYLKIRVQSDSSNYQELISQQERIQQLEIAQQIVFFENIQDTLQVDIDQLLEAEKATGSKKKLQRFFEQLQENLEDLQRLQQTNEYLFLELDSSQQKLFSAYRRGEILTMSQYRRYRKKLQLRKKSIRYQANIYQIEKKRQSVFIDTENLNEFFAAKEWNNSLFTDLMSYMNQARCPFQGKSRDLSENHNL